MGVLNCINSDRCLHNEEPMVRKNKVLETEQKDFSTSYTDHVEEENPEH